MSGLRLRFMICRIHHSSQMILDPLRPWPATIMVYISSKPSEMQGLSNRSKVGYSVHYSENQIGGLDSRDGKPTKPCLFQNLPGALAQPRVQKTWRRLDDTGHCMSHMACIEPCISAWSAKPLPMAPSVRLTRISPAEPGCGADEIQAWCGCYSSCDP